ncbi:3-hydroxyacyl-CoA dehydrogenase [Dactylosporangium sp. CA-092794]|uniref:3-hydroxyacyl-CoA dehydrogenase n=1 Tax=Dactylosporangium sp. CA-092794 TaxID=3239929 RepID=UPI003D89C880
MIRIAGTDPIGVVGAGTMGSGIAQVAAVAGHPVTVYDTMPGAAERALVTITDRVRRLVAKGRLDIDADTLRLRAATTLDDLAESRCVIEAVAEDLDVKRALFADLEKVVPVGCVLATNTSSLSPTAIAARLQHPGRLVGMHFFNPVPLMRLVEVVSGPATAPETADAVADLAEAWGKTVVRAAPTPGFIVNRLARPYYAEAFRLMEEHAATPATIDAVLTEAGGFRLGALALVDLIGHDVNEAVTRSVWASFDYDARFAPSSLQRSLVEAGWLGRKSGRGFYEYTGDAPPPPADAAAPRPTPAEVADHGATQLRSLLRRSGAAVLEHGGGEGFVRLPTGGRLVRCDGRTATAIAAEAGEPVIVVDRTLDDGTATGIALAASGGCPPAVLDDAIGLLQAAGLRVHIVDDVAGLVVTRVVAMLVNLAVDALHQRVATARDIDAAMKLGTNYPIGPLEWGQRWGAPTVLHVLEAMQRWYGDGRYRPSPLLRRMALTGWELT